VKLSFAEIAAVLGYVVVMAWLVWPRKRAEEVWRDKPWPRAEERDG
jgi:hypothetical protein